MKHEALTEPKPLKAFRDNYLAAVMMVAALFMTSFVSAQSDSAKYSRINGYGFGYKRFVLDSLMMIPLSTSPHTPYRAGAIRYKAADSTLQVWTGHQWNSIISGSTGIDTAYAQDDSTLVIETPEQVYFVKILGKPWATQIDDSTFYVGDDTITIHPPSTGINQLTGDITAGPGSGSQAATIASNAVTDSKIRQSAGLSVIGRSTNTTGNVADIAAATDNQVLRRSGTGIGFGAVNLASSNAVTGILPIGNTDTSSSPNHLITQSDLNDTAAVLRAAIGSGGGISGLTAGRVVISTSGTTVGDDAGLTYDAPTNKLTTDTLIIKKNRLDSSQYSTQVIPYGRISQINFFGNSITQYLNASPNDSAYPVLIADTLKAYWNNYALSGMGVFYACQKHDSIVQGPFNNAATSVAIGYNDVRVTSVGVRTYRKVASGIKAMFLNHFANMYIPASTTPTDTTVNRYGTFTVGQDAMQWSGKTKNAAYTSTINDSIVWKCQPATTIGVNLIAGDSLLYNHSIVELFIDGVSYGQYNTNNIADSAALIGAVNTRISYPIIIGGLSNVPHTVKLVNKASRIMYVDYFTTLSNNKPSFIIFHNIAGVPGTASNKLAANAAIDSMVTTLPSGFPVLVVKTNNFWDNSTGMSGDNVHPNNRGHHQIYDAFRSVYDSAVARPGTMSFDGRNIWVSGGNTMHKMLNASDAWTKGDVAMNVAGYINLPYNMSIKQNGTDILKTDEVRQNTLLGYQAGYQQITASGNTAIGHRSLASATTGGANTAIGQLALGSNVSGTNNTAVGYQAAYANTGTGATAVGMYSLFSNSSGSNNTAVGKQALFANTAGNDNTVMGFEALSVGTTGNENSGLGLYALKQTTGNGNVAIGAHTVERNTTGGYNVGIGRYAMFFHDAGDGNVAIGNGALYGTSSAKSYNTAIGYGALGAVNGADGNIGIGYNAGDNITTGAKNIVIGYDIDAPSATTSNQLVIGNVIFGTGITGTGTTIAGKIGIGINTPTARFHLVAGTAAGNTAPLKLTSGTNLTTPEDGAVEYDGTDYFVTNSTARYTLSRTLKNSATWDPASVGASSSTSTTLTVTGAALGDPVTISKTSGSYSNGEVYFAYVSATNTVTIQLQNVSGGTFDIASATFNVVVLKY